MKLTIAHNSEISVSSLIISTLTVVLKFSFQIQIPSQYNVYIQIWIFFLIFKIQYDLNMLINFRKFIKRIIEKEEVK